MKGFRAGILVMVLLSAPFTVAMAQSMTQAESSELAAFPLTEDYLTRLIAADNEITDKRIKVARDVDITQVTALAELVDATTLEAIAVLDKHGMSAHDYLFGRLALVDAVQGAAPNASPEELSYTNPQNIAFYRAHKAQIDAFLGS